MRFVKYIFFVFRLTLGCLLCAMLSASAQDSLLDKRIEYVYHFSQEVVWPNFSHQQQFYIELVGRNSSFYNQLESFFSDKTVRGKTISVSNTQDWRSRNRATRPNIVYVDETSLHYLPTIVRFFDGYPVLIVSGKPCMEKGWMVSFTERFLDDSYLNGSASQWGYSLNCETIEQRARLSISSRLRDGALLVIPVQKRKMTVAQEVFVPASATSSRDRRTGTRGQSESRVENLDRQRVASHSMERGSYEKIASDDTVNQSCSDFSTKFTYDSPVLALSRQKDSAFARGVESEVQLPKAGFKDSRPLLSSVDLRNFGALSFLLSLGVALLVFSYGFHLHVLRNEINRAPSVNAACVTQDVSTLDPQYKIHNSFFANVSHEFRTPLNAIVGLSQLLVSEGVKESELKPSLEIINQCAQGILRIVDGVVTKAKIDTGEMVLEETQGNPVYMLDALSLETKELLKNMGKAGVVSFRQELDRSIPSSVSLDYEKVQSLLGVLLSNAVRFTTLGEVVLGCGMCRIDRGSLMHFYVHDTGRGMGEMQVEELEQHFIKAEKSPHAEYALNADAEISGLGFGLSIAVGLAKILGTQLVVKSSPGLGTQVSFDLPLRNQTNFAV